MSHFGQVNQKNVYALSSIKFSMGHTKTSYVVRYGLGPVAQKELVKDINTENLLTLLLDETTTKQVVKHGFLDTSLE